MPQSTQPGNSYKQLAALIGGDALALLLFAWVGRSSHALSALDIAAGLSTAAPFIISWFLITPWFGLYRAGVSQTWQKLLPRLLLAWLVIGGPLALVLRALFLGRPIPGGIIPIFALITLSITTLFMVTWRLAYIWWMHRHLSRNNQAKDLKL